MANVQGVNLLNHDKIITPLSVVTNNTFPEVTPSSNMVQVKEEGDYHHAQAKKDEEEKKAEGLVLRDNDSNRYSAAVPKKRELLNYQLPPCEYPDGILTVQKFVLSAVKKKHEKCYNSDMERIRSQQMGVWSEGAGSGTTTAYIDNSSKSLEGYRAIIDQLVKRNEPSMVYRVLLSLAHGEALNLVASQPKYHPHLVHLIFRMDPFTKPKKEKNKQQRNSPMEEDEVEEQEEANNNGSEDDLYGSFKMADAHLQLCLALVSANGTFASPMIDAMVKCLSKISPDELSDQDISERSYRIHACLCRLQSILPGAVVRDQLATALDGKFPYCKKSSKDNIASYISELMRILDYAPSLADIVFHITMRRALELDVEIRIHEGGKATIEKNEDGEMEDDNEEEEKKDQQQEADKTMQGIDSTQQRGKSELSADEADEMADKLDVIMLKLFQYIETKCHTVARLIEMYGTITQRTFRPVVLPTYKSKFVQFIVFYLCARFHQLTAETNMIDKYDIEPLDRHFVSSLIELILDARQATTLRQISACYLASFVSRSNFVDAHTVCETLAALLQWSELYIHQVKSTFSSPSQQSSLGISSSSITHHDDGRDHAVFYTVCQAAMYTMCFRGQEAWDHYQSTVERQSSSMNDMNDDASYVELHTIDIGPARWQRILCPTTGSSSSSRRSLRPLQFCLESVRREFLDLASKLKLLPNDFIMKKQQDDMERHKKLSGSMEESTNDSPPRTPASARIRTKGVRRCASMPRGRGARATMRRRWSGGGGGGGTAILTPALLEQQKQHNSSSHTIDPSKVGGVGGMGEGSNPLDSFFPFDPYLLQQSHVYIQPFYRSWQGTDNEGENEQCDGDDTMMMEEDGIVQDQTRAKSAQAASDEQPHGDLDDSDKDDDDDSNHCVHSSMKSDDEDHDLDDDDHHQQHHDVLEDDDWVDEDETQLDPNTMGFTLSLDRTVVPTMPFPPAHDHHGHRKQSIASDGSW